ncbi:hypothetical protein QNA08_06815 [Chelatococcus sp. SYSU_G07232]|uniref:Membrane transporter protein n=1 Tax=Chelatococcus albus TaxID=3047466 RepID=A0ABT7AGH5_9HYPH|nr:hypothetical protein [Chelatococcus sp. SYSU_G07232]MDJ1157944.1 hypothetical protein [Chelatococcus sp. SYSU_G07232]
MVGLIVGGALAAPLAGWLSRVLPLSELMTLVAFILAGMSIYNFARLGAA